METLKLKIHYEELNITALQLMNNLMFLEIENHHPET